MRTCRWCLSIDRRAVHHDRINGEEKGGGQNFGLRELERLLTSVASLPRALFGWIASMEVVLNGPRPRWGESAPPLREEVSDMAEVCEGSDGKVCGGSTCRYYAKQQSQQGTRHVSRRSTLMGSPRQFGATQSAPTKIYLYFVGMHHQFTF